VGGPPDGTPPPPGTRRFVRLAAIYPFSGRTRTNVPPEKFRAVAGLLPMPVYWSAGPEETLTGATRFEDLGELSRWLAGARVFLGNDSGIAHLAAACGVPVVALFGPTDPRVWAPRGPRVQVAQWDWSPQRVAQEVLSCC